jgi:hypothetical protein
LIADSIAIIWTEPVVDVAKFEAAKHPGEQMCELRRESEEVMTTPKRTFEKIIPGSMKQRVRIAKDVIAQVTAKRFVPVSGTYVGLAGSNPDGCAPHGETTDARLMLAKVKRCRVCAVGGLLISMIDRFDALMIGHGGDVESLHHAACPSDRRYLSQLFPDADLIEDAFESTSSYAWSNRYHDDADRFIGIMENIVRNEGAFVIDDIPEKVNV